MDSTFIIYYYFNSLHFGVFLGIFLTNGWFFMNCFAKGDSARKYVLTAVRGLSTGIPITSDILALILQPCAKHPMNRRCCRTQLVNLL